MECVNKIKTWIVSNQHFIVDFLSSSVVLIHDRFSHVVSWSCAHGGQSYWLAYDVIVYLPIVFFSKKR